MSITKQDEAKAKLAQKRAFQRDLAKRRLEQQIGSSFVLGIKPEIEFLLHWCIIEEPVQIKSVTFRKSVIRLEIDWPFRLPEPTGDSDTYFPTGRSIRQFAEDLRIYLLEQNVEQRLQTCFTMNSKSSCRDFSEPRDSKHFQPRRSQATRFVMSCRELARRCGAVIWQGRTRPLYLQGEQCRLSGKDVESSGPFRIYERNFRFR